MVTPTYTVVLLQLASMLDPRGKPCHLTGRLTQHHWRHYQRNFMIAHFQIYNNRSTTRKRESKEHNNQKESIHKHEEIDGENVRRLLCHPLQPELVKSREEPQALSQPQTTQKEEHEVHQRSYVT